MPRLYRLLPCSFVLLAACGSQPTSVTFEEKQLKDCPVRLHAGQTLNVSLPSNPTTGFRWEVREAAPQVLHSLGPEVYTTPEDAGIVGSAGLSTWRYQVRQSGSGRLLMQYRQPWETEAPPAEVIDCLIEVR